MLKKGLIWLLVLAFCVGAVGLTSAQDAAKPLAVVSYAGYDRTMKTLEFIGQLAGKPDLAAGMEQMLKMMTGGQGLQGLDPKQPWGVVIQAQGTEVDGYAFFPVTDLKQLLTILTPFIGPSTESGGLFKIERGAQAFYAKKLGNWAFVAAKETQLAKLPDDPAKLLGDLPKNYLWAVRLFVANLPAQLRDLAVAQIQMISQAMLAQAQGTEQELIRARMQRSLQQLERAVKELDQVTLGFEVDRQARKAHLDVQLTALPDTKMAKDIAAGAALKTDFAGFADPKAAIVANWNAFAANPPTTEELNKQIDVLRKKALEQLGMVGLSEEDSKTAQKILDDLLDVARQTILGGRIDGGMCLVLEANAATSVVGGRIAAGAKLNDALKRLVDLAVKAAPDAADMVKFNAGTLAGMQLHTATIPVPPDVENRPQVVKLVGENLDLVVAVGEESAYLAVGRDAMDALKQVVARSQAERGKAAQPLAVTVSLIPLSRFIAEVGDEQAKQNFRRIHEQIKGLAGKDALRLTVNPVERGLQIRLEAEEAVLKAAASSAPIGGPMGAP
jgi:hypothetical protein